MLRMFPGTLSNKKKIYIYIYIFVLLSSKKKKIVTEQNNGRQAHDKPNRLQRKQPTDSQKKKKKPNLNTKQITKSETSNQ